MTDPRRPRPFLWLVGTYGPAVVALAAGILLALERDLLALAWFGIAATLWVQGYRSVTAWRAGYWRGRVDSHLPRPPMTTPDPWSPIPTPPGEQPAPEAR